MKLIYYLEHFKASTLKKILEGHGIRTKEKSPSKLLNHLLHLLLDVHYLKQLYQGLSLEEKEVIDFFIIHRPNQMFSYRSLNQKFDSIHRDRFEKGIHQLMAKGLLFQLKRNYGDIGFTIPHDLFQLFHQIIFAKRLNPLSKKVQFIEHLQEQGKNIDEEFYQFLSGLYFLLSPEGEIGKLNKQQLNKLLKRIQLEESKLEYFPIHYEIEGLTKTISLLIYLAKGLGLIQFKQNQFSINSKKIHDWLQLSPFTRHELIEGMIRFSFQSSDLLINHFFHRLFSLSKGKWFHAHQLIEELSNQLHRSIDESFYYRIEQEVLKPMEELGFLTYTGDWRKELFLKMKEQVNEEIEQFYVQPNFEVLVPSHLAYSLRLELEHFADLERRDQLCLYKITKASLIKGLEMGKSIEEILDFLERYSAIPIHQNMKTILIDWAKGYGAIQFYDVRILKCENKEIASHLKQELQDWIIDEITPLHFIVKKEKHFEQAIKQLKDLGYIPTKRILTEKEIYREDSTSDVFEEEDEFILFKHPDYELVLELESFPAITKP
ncbi:helicase-associated domain-containing protein [Tepidibacillus sp. LV47]|uniref:helicase-associated domain-containing protein n=1 Tax=Tepidibacillus sp. LV47 TaxID=3398228 RepID=UPI003AAE7266